MTKELTAIQRDEQRRAAEELLPLLRDAHKARNSDELMQTLAVLAPVPNLWHTIKVEGVYRQLGVMVLAYAMLVDELMREPRSG